MITHNLNYADIISIGSLFQAWSEFKKGKRKRKDVQIFERNLEDNLFKLHEKLKFKTYLHGEYYSLKDYIPLFKLGNRFLRFKKLEEKRNSENFNQSLQSYLGYLKHANAHNLSKEIVMLRSQHQS